MVLMAIQHSWYSWILWSRECRLHSPSIIYLVMIRWAVLWLCVSRHLQLYHSWRQYICVTCYEVIWCNLIVEFCFSSCDGCLYFRDCWNFVVIVPQLYLSLGTWWALLALSLLFLKFLFVEEKVVELLIIVEYTSTNNMLLNSIAKGLLCVCAFYSTDPLLDC